MNVILITTKYRKVTVFMFIALSFAAISHIAHANHSDGSNNKPPKRVFNVQMENDLFGKGTDRHYTHGSRISFLVPFKEEDARKKFPIIDKATRKIAKQVVNTVDRTPLISKKYLTDKKARRLSFIMGQNIYTPEDITVRELIPSEQPYAGWLYIGVGLVTVEKNKDLPYLENLELDIGYIGPTSLGDQVQSEWHRVIDVEQPEGWDNQLKDELGILMNYERKWPKPLNTDNWLFDAELDFTPSVGGALGNVYTYLSVGGMMRFGRDLPNDYGPPRIRPGLMGSGFFEPHSGFGWYLFAGAEGRAVARNIFLDGNTFRDSHSVDKKHFVGDIQAGIVLTFDRAQISFTNIFRSREYEGQKEADEFGSINISFRF